MASSRVRYKYPISAILAVAAAWLLFAVNLIAITCMLMWMALFPVAPFVVTGLAGLIVSAHNYALSVRTPIST